jgi:hypothetical protein
MSSLQGYRKAIKGKYMETLEEFIPRLTERVRCFYHKCKSGVYSLKKADTNLKRRMGVFAWVGERKKDNVFEIQSYKKLGDKSNVTHLADKIVPGAIFVSKKQDFGQGTGITFYVQKDSRGPDYEKAVEALKAILSLK